MDKRKIKSFYTFLQSQETAQRFLRHCYRKIQDGQDEQNSYANCTTFMYYLDHGLTFYESGKKLSLLAQPMLFFYGMTHLLKANLLAKRPYYPESTSMLAHGVSTRKRKKKNYAFLDDEVKIQLKGLLPYANDHLFLQKQIPFTKIKMADLLALIPELAPLFDFNHRQSLTTVGHSHSKVLRFPLTLLDTYHLTQTAFTQRLQSYLPETTAVTVDEDAIYMHLRKPINPPHIPFFWRIDDSTIHFPTYRDHFLPVSEVVIHYLLLYIFSMLSRYEAGWWGELLAFRSDMDFPLIQKFLKTTAEKIPLLIGYQLYHQWVEDQS